MTNEIKQAFGHPEVRAIATRGSDFADRISVRGHIEDVEIGAFQAERDNTQRLKFDLVVEVADHQGAASDDVDLILSYDSLTDAISHELAAERLDLLETLAEKIAARVLLQPQACRVFVRIEKLDRGSGALGVEIVRGRDQHAKPTEIKSTTAPILVYLKTHTEFSRWLDNFEKLSAPVVICLEKPKTPTPAATDERSRQHIDLLEIEQSVWALASQDDRCLVVSSRTELDWAIAQNALCIWVPTKTVMNAVNGPKGKVSGLELTRWLAEELNAKRLISVADGQKTSGFESFRSSDFKDFT